jgi:large subunit ribosomal protein L25
VAIERVKLEVRTRDGVGRKHVRAVREAGDIPGVIYRTGESTPIAINARDLRHAVTGPGGMHALMDVVVDGGKTARAAIIKDIQVDPVRDRVVHVDFHEIPLDQKIATVVPIHLEGSPAGVNMGGVLSQPTHEVNISVLPTEIPESLSADVSGLEIGGSLRLADIAAPEGVEFLDDPDSTVLATVTAPIAEEEPEVEEGLEEGEEAAEGEAPEGEAEQAGEEAPAEE